MRKCQLQIVNTDDDIVIASIELNSKEAVEDVLAAAAGHLIKDIQEDA
jgi:hypothetical protein